MLLVKLVKFQMCSPGAKAAYKHHCEIVTFDGEIKPKAPNRKPTRRKTDSPLPAYPKKIGFEYTRLAAN